MKKGLLISVAAFLLFHGSVQAIEVYNQRADWDAAFVGPRWDVDLAAYPNALQDGDVVTADSDHAAIRLPPDFDNYFKFNVDFEVTQVARIDGWNNYIDPDADPVVLSIEPGGEPVSAEFKLPVGKFGFEILVHQLSDSDRIILNLSNGDSLQYELADVSAPQFFGWVNDSKDDVVESFTISTESDFLIGNFVVPDGGTTLLLLGIGLVAMAGLRRISQARTT